MPSGVFLRKIDLDLIYPPFLERLLVLKARCIARGAKYITTYGFRTWGESHQLYLEHLKGGVKAAPAGLSAHNYGLATDEALVISEPSPSTRRTSALVKDFKIMSEEAAKLGLDWGGRFNDAPHIGWPGFVSGDQLRPLLKIWAANSNLPIQERLRLVWDHVDKHGPKLSPVSLQ